MKALPDQQMIRRISQGDEAAFVQLCAHFRAPAFRLCSDVLKDEAEAERIINAVFAGIWEERVNLLQQDNFQSYLFVRLRTQLFRQMAGYADISLQNQFMEKMRAQVERKASPHTI